VTSISSTASLKQTNSQWKWFFLVAAIFLSLNFLTVTRYPSVWVDEIQFADPAVNLATGHGFTSTAWFGQGAHEFFAGNVPLYSLVLSVWLKIWGVSPVAVRSLNFLLVIMLCAVLWDFAEKSGLIGSTRWRVAFISLVMCGHCVMFSYRMGRYDVLGMILFSLAARAWIAKTNTVQFAGLFLAGTYMPWTGLQLLPAAVVTCGVLLLFRLRDSFWKGLSLGSGIATGGVFLFFLYRSHNVWDAFRASTSGIGTIGGSLASKLARLPGSYSHDKSGLLLLVACLVVLCSCLFSRNLGQLKFLLGVAVLAVALPAALQLAGKFPVYYGWMTFLPLSLGLAHTLEQKKNLNGGIRAFALCAVLLAATVGLPLRLLAIGARWNEHDAQAVSELTRRNVRQGDVVIGDFKTYYALKQTAKEVYLPTYLDAITPDERKSVTLMILRPEDVKRAGALLSEGTWTESRESPPSLLVKANPLDRICREFQEEEYSVTIFRREASNSAASPMVLSFTK